MLDEFVVYLQNTPYTMFGIIIGLTSTASYFICNRCIINNNYLFLAAGLKGKDYGRPNSPPISEAIGVICCGVYLSCIAINLGIPYLINYNNPKFVIENYFSLEALLAGSWSISSMCLLGFTDDVLNLKWRNKLILPFISSFPLLLIYIIQNGSTFTLVPYPFKIIFGSSIDLGLLFYCYILLFTVFSTNSINILAGINGLEVGQSIIIAISMLVFAFIEIYLENIQVFTVIYFIAPFLAVSLSLLKFNWYPASVFVGDTYCYFAGMTFAVCGILGHCSKIFILLFIPQILNFIYSFPQLFKLLPCPRHRLPYYNAETGLREPSTFVVRVNTLHIGGCVILGLMARFGFAKITRKGLDTAHSAEVDNMTLINFYLRLYGPTQEEMLTRKLLEFHVLCAAAAIFSRYTIALILF
ncbi:hypothetical protein HZS_6759 [Henneguya salminicola]|uniref:UDP-N-acetylglucosamine--dolichyl-phosphate N-acetylglucosaminephosphotransferase n=1 Tax=Henneguya salminicola TaxID=69463 RepID=A0A6G3MF51_HENSL|nr:hypothetical protein HZS_6759 [Henneguya salminicola]